jgi:hypothetical protein
LTNGVVELEPALLVVSCENVKTELRRLLDSKDNWKGKIFVTIDPVRSMDDGVFIRPMDYADAWHYRMLVPSRIQRDHLMLGLVRVLLLEMSNQSTNRERNVDVPFWLTEGIRQQLEATVRSPMILQRDLQFDVGAENQPWLRPMNRNFQSKLRADPLEQSRLIFQKKPPLNFNELSLMSESDIHSEAEYQHFRASSQLFVSELLKLHDGKKYVRETLRQMPNFYNWQFAFLKGFEPCFKSALDVEKWWAVTSVTFTTHDRFTRLDGVLTLDRLDEALQVPIETRVSSNSIPQKQIVPLRTVIESTDYSHQRLALVTVVGRLQALGIGGTPELARLVSDYRTTLETYVNRRDRLSGSAASLVKDTVKQLGLLDILREDFRHYGDLGRPVEPAAVASP